MAKPISIEVTFKNGKKLLTGINATLKEAQDYYIGNYFNLGRHDDDVQVAVKVVEV